MRQKEYKRRILIDAMQEEETRVAVIGENNELEELDFELQRAQQLKSNIYLAKVIRIEPSLQAAFVEYGGNRHGFLSFPEIHPDYFRIPVADREKLKEMQIEEAKKLQEAEDRQEAEIANLSKQPDFISSESSAEVPPSQPIANESETSAQNKEIPQIIEPVLEDPKDHKTTEEEKPEEKPKKRGRKSKKDKEAEEKAALELAEQEEKAKSPQKAINKKVETDDTLQSLLGPSPRDNVAKDLFETSPLNFKNPNDDFLASDAFPNPEINLDNSSEEFEHIPPELSLETDSDPTAEGESKPKDATTGQKPRSMRSNHLRRRRPQQQRPSVFSLHRMYKIQEVLQKGQVLLIQIVKEERQNKGAAITTYLSLPGRYCVLMPNNPRGGGISRKITDYSVRRKIKDMINSLEVPKGMGVIIRTAGTDKTKAEVKRDLDYLFRLWDKIREETLVSTAPSLVYEEGNLIKRSIRDLYSKGVDEIIVEGEKGYETAKDFMRMLIPSKTRQVIQYKEPQIPLFTKHNLEKKLEAIHDPVVHLKSGGYLVINSTEALIAIDINSGRSTKERNIRETAYNTNLEAAKEIPRQLRLRDLAGLIVVDFIDMDNSRHNTNVERAFREGVKNDRAKIQVGHISQFGLLELSRQRLRPSIFETHFKTCPHCSGSGAVRTNEATALAALRDCQETAINDSTITNIDLIVRPEVALYILNHKRALIDKIIESCSVSLEITTKSDLEKAGHELKITKAKKVGSQKGKQPAKEKTEAQKTNAQSSEEGSPKPRHRRGRRPKPQENDQQKMDAAPQSSSDEKPVDSPSEGVSTTDSNSSDEQKPRRRGRRRSNPKKAEISATTESNSDDARQAPPSSPIKEETKMTAPPEPVKKEEPVNLNDGVTTPVKKGPKKKGWWGNLIS